MTSVLPSQDLSDLAVVIVQKPVNKTSNDVVAQCKKLLGIKKVGHGGTLDPFATGLLPLFIGHYTKLSSLFHDAQKRYVATLKLGVKTETGDATGAVSETKRVPKISPLQYQLLQRSLLGKQKLKIPLYSAKKVNGKPLYKLAREKKVTESCYYQQVVIEDLQITPSGPDLVTIVAKVSSGTYMRSLAELIAQKVGTVGHLTTLERTHYYLPREQVLNSGISLENGFLEQGCSSTKAVFFGSSLNTLVPFIPLKRTLYRSFLLGGLRFIPLIPTGWSLLTKQNGQPLGLIFAEKGFIKQRVFFPAHAHEYNANP